MICPGAYFTFLITLLITWLKGKAKDLTAGSQLFSSFCEQFARCNELFQFLQSTLFLYLLWFLNIRKMFIKFTFISTSFTFHFFLKLLNSVDIFSFNSKKKKVSIFSLRKFLFNWQQHRGYSFIYSFFLCARKLNTKEIRKIQFATSTFAKINELSGLLCLWFKAIMLA